LPDFLFICSNLSSTILKDKNIVWKSVNEARERF